MSEIDRACDRPDCDNPARVHLTEVVDNKMTTQYLCKSCAEEKGLNPASGQGVDVAGFLEQLVRGDDVDEPGAATEPCTFCGLSLDGFRETGRLGCPHCYTTFEPGLRRLLNRIHGAARHTGKVYLPPDPAAGELDRRLGDLRRRLQSAVDTEDFERAATLRDQIRELEPAGST